MDLQAESLGKPLRRWPGVLLSLLIPGFGMIRAGLYEKGGCWFLGIQLAGAIVAFLLVKDYVPLFVAGIGLAASLILQFWVIYDSFRPGKMNLRLWLIFAGVFVVFAIIKSPALWIINAFAVPTSSMEPTVMGSNQGKTTADRVLVDRLYYQFHMPKRGDLIVFTTAGIVGFKRFEVGHPSDKESIYIKRVVGLPGERIKIANGRVFANGKLLGPKDGVPDFHYEMPRPLSKSDKYQGEDFVVGEKEYFVLGDHTTNSLDSRYWGNVPEACLRGKISMIYYPFSRLGRIGKTD